MINIRPNNTPTQIDVLNRSNVANEFYWSSHLIPGQLTQIYGAKSHALPTNIMGAEGLFSLAGEGLGMLIQKLVPKKHLTEGFAAPFVGPTKPQAINIYEQKLIDINGGKALFITYGNSGGKAYSNSNTRNNAHIEGEKNRKFGINPYYNINRGDEDDGDGEKRKSGASKESNDFEMLSQIKAINSKLSALRIGLAGQDALLSWVPENIVIRENAANEDLLLNARTTIASLTELGTQLNMRIESPQRLSNRYTNHLEIMRSISNSIMQDLILVERLLNCDNQTKYSLSNNSGEDWDRRFLSPMGSNLGESIMAAEGYIPHTSLDNVQLNKNLGYFVSNLSSSAATDFNMSPHCHFFDNHLLEPK